MTLFIITIWTAMAAGADIFFKFAKGYDWRFACGAALYALCSMPAMIVFKKLDFSMVVIIWNAVSVLVSVAIGVFFFHDRISTLRICAAVLALSAIVLSQFDQTPGQ